MNIVEVLTEYRKALKTDAEGIWSIMERRIEAEQLLPESNPAEMRANLMLAYRHLEDARMRLGKVIQAYDGGKSVYDQ